MLILIVWHRSPLIGELEKALNYFVVVFMSFARWRHETLHAAAVKSPLAVMQNLQLLDFLRLLLWEVRRWVAAHIHKAHGLKRCCRGPKPCNREGQWSITDDRWQNRQTNFLHIIERCLEKWLYILCSLYMITKYFHNFRNKSSWYFIIQ